MLATGKLVTVFSILAAGMIVAPVFALKVTEPAAASHGYPGMCDINGKKLANGEFRQWMEDNRLHVVITYKFSDGEVYEEHSQFRQNRELIQEKWSWKESKHGKAQREFAVDFLSGIGSVHISQDNKNVSKKVEIEPGRTFAGFGFSLALSNLRKRLLRGEQVQLKAVGFSEFPTLGPQVVTVTISHGGIDHMRMSGRSLKGDRFTVHPEIPFIERRTPLGRLGEPDEVASLAQFLASDEAAYITGQNIAIDGGLTAGWTDYELVPPANVREGKWIDDP